LDSYGQDNFIHLLNSLFSVTLYPSRGLPVAALGNVTPKIIFLFFLL